MVWMLAQYGHNYLKIDSRLDIASHLFQAERIEPALHSLQAFYRDHFLHAIEVCLLGHFLLLTKDETGTYLWKYVAMNLQNARRTHNWPTDDDEKEVHNVESLENVLQLWYVAALFHDVGYSIQVFEALQNILEFYFHPIEMIDFRNNLKKASEKLSDSLKKSNLAGLLGVFNFEKLGNDHGIIGAAHLKGLLGQLNKDKYAGNYYPAIRAIGLHNERRINVDFKIDPLGVLLIICDTIQEWNRPHLRFATAPSMIMARLLSMNNGIEDLSGSLHTVSLNVERSEYRKVRPDLQFNKTLLITLIYNDEIQTNSGVFNLWIDSSCNLQRVILDSLPFNIEITFRTPLFIIPSSDPESQMSRLRDMIADTHTTFLNDWLPISPDGFNVNRAVHYEKDGGYDILTLDLKQLSKQKTITGDIDRLRKHLKTWKRYNEDRDFEGDYSPFIPGKD